MTFFLQLIILLVCIFIGARMSGIGLGVTGMIGLLILLFVFGLQPADPPLKVMLIILSLVTAAHMGITASPVYAASAALLTVWAANHLQLADILMVCIPSTLIGVIFKVLFVLKRGKQLDQDPEFIEKMKDTVFAQQLNAGEQQITKIQRKSGVLEWVAIFTMSVPGVVLPGKYVLNHTFMLPGIVTITMAIIAGLMLKSILL